MTGSFSKGFGLSRKSLALLVVMCLVLGTGIMLWKAPAAHASAYFNVSSTLDDGSIGTLRWAITQANAYNLAEADILITFNGLAPGTTIPITSGNLPDVGNTMGKPIKIDGSTTMPAGGPVEINGNMITAEGFRIASGNNQIQNMNVRKFINTGISIVGGINTISSCKVAANGKDGVYMTGGLSTITGSSLVSNGAGGSGNGIFIGGTSDNVIDNCGIGWDTFTGAPGGNNGAGVYIQNGASRNTVRNSSVVYNTVRGIVITGAGSKGNRVNNCGIGWNRFIGPSGGPAGNTGSGIFIDNGAESTAIGETGADRNYINCNTGHGVEITGAMTRDTRIYYNNIGVDSSLADQGNANSGIYINGAQVCNIGVPNMSERCNYVNGNGGNGIEISGTTGCKIVNNCVGAYTGGPILLLPLAARNDGKGIYIRNGAPQTIIGGSISTGESNVVSGNGSDGIELEGSGVTNCKIYGNYIGTGYGGGSSIGNSGNGVFLINGPTNNVIGSTGTDQANTIMFNTANGISITNDPGNTTCKNNIGINKTSNNSGLGINLIPDGGPNSPLGSYPYDPGGALFHPNNWMQMPVITSANNVGSNTEVRGTAYPSSQVYLYLADSGAGFGEGSSFLNVPGNPVTADPMGNWAISVNPQQPVGTWLTAMATYPSNSESSEFSQNISISGASAGPHIDYDEPDNGPVGATFVIHGSGFGSAAAADYVQFNGGARQNSYLYWADNTIKLQVPPGATTGNMWVHHAGVDSNPVWFTVTGGGAGPAITDVTPNRGTYDTPIRISGTDLGSGAGCTLRIGGYPAIIDYWDPAGTYVSARIPKQPYKGAIELTTPGGMANYDITVYPTVTSITPDLTNRTGVLLATIRGTNFDYENGGDDIETWVQRGSTRWNGGDFMNVNCDSFVAVFGLLNSPVGKYDVNVKNTRTGQTGTLKDGLTAGNPGPNITRLDPTSGPYGTPVTITGTDFGAPTATSYVSFTGGVVSAANTDSWTDTGIVVRVPEGAGAGPVSVTTAAGTSNGVDFTPTLSRTFYFAEGSTRDNATDGRFDEYLCIMNPNAEATKVGVYFMTAGGTQRYEVYSVGGQRRMTINVVDVIGRGQDVALAVVADLPIAAERAMYFDYRGKWNGGHAVTGAPNPSKSWYFAEGTTRDNPRDGSFDEWLCIANPNDRQATATITYNASGTPVVVKATVPPFGRITRDVAADVGREKDVSITLKGNLPLVAERPEYFNYHGIWPGGDTALGATNPARDFYFSEGFTYTWAREWVCIANPGTAVANVGVTYQMAGGTHATSSVTVPAGGRYTLDVASAIGLNKDVSVALHSDVPVVAERSQYFSYGPGWEGGAFGTGAPTPRETFYFAEGTTRSNAIDGSFDEWISIENPNGHAAAIKLTFVKPNGISIVQNITVGPGTRSTVSANSVLGPDMDCSLILTSSVPVVAERPMYFDYHGFAEGGHDTRGYGL